MNNGGLDIDYWSAGLIYTFSNAVDIELETGSYGQGRDINVDTIDLKLGINTNNWSFAIEPQFGRIDILNTFNNRIRKIESKGIGLSSSYYGIENWELSLSYDRYNYSIDPRKLSLPIVVAIFSSKALLVTSGLKEDIIAADITYLLNNTDISLYYAKSKSAIDGSSTDAASLSFDFYQFSPYKIGIELGTVGSDFDNANHYAGVTLGYLW